MLPSKTCHVVTEVQTFSHKMAGTGHAEKGAAEVRAGSVVGHVVAADDK